MEIDTKELKVLQAFMGEVYMKLSELEDEIEQVRDGIGINWRELTELITKGEKSDDPS